LESVFTKDKLQSHHKESHPIRLVECDYPRDEIIACGLDIKEKIKEAENNSRGTVFDINNCAILVPKNKQARSAMAVLSDMGLPVSGRDTLRLFDSSEFQSLFRVLKIINNPNDDILFTEMLFDPLADIDPIVSHRFIKEHDVKKMFLVDLLKEDLPNLFNAKNSVENWLQKLAGWIEKSKTLNMHSLIQLVGDDFLLNTAQNHETLVARVEVIRTLIHLVLSQIEKNPKTTLKDFLAFLDRLESYDENIPLAVFGSEEGIKVLTLHSSKGLEFDYVWIAHLDERSLMSGKKQAFSVPENILTKIEQKDEEVAKRQLYVAITRAKRFCILSYSRYSYLGAEQELAQIVADLPPEIFEKQTFSETEKIILGFDPKAYVEKKAEDKKSVKLEELKKLVAKEYEDRNVSVSLLNNFFECPWKWYFRNLLRLPEPTSESLEFGNAVHGSLDRILKMTKSPTPGEVKEIVRGEVQKRKYQNEQKYQRVEQEVLDIVTLWVRGRLGEIEKNRENEKSISMRDDRFPNLNIYGKIDLIENLSGEEVRVTDFKTGGVKKKSEIEKKDEEGKMSGYLRQLAMYSFLLQESPKWRKIVHESRLEFLEAKDKKEAIFSKVIGKEEILLLVKDIREYDQLVKSGEWTSLPCHYNSYGKNTECEYCQRAEIYKNTGPLSSQPK